MPPRRNTNRRAINEAAIYAGGYADSAPFRLPLVPADVPPEGAEVFCANADIAPGASGLANLQELSGGVLSEVSPTDTQTVYNMTSSPIWSGCCFSVTTLSGARVVLEHNCAVAFLAVAGEDWRCNDREGGQPVTTITVDEPSPLGGDGGPATSVEATLPTVFVDDINAGDRVTIWYDGGVWRCIPYSHEDLKLFELRSEMDVGDASGSADEVDLNGNLITGGVPLDVHDPFRVFRGRAGARGVAATFSRRDCGLVIIWLQQPSRFIVGNLTGAMTENPSGGWDGMISTTTGNNPFGLPFSSALQLSNAETAFDPFGKFSLVQQGKKVFAVYDDTNDRYLIVYGDTGGGRVAGTIVNNFTEAASTFQINGIGVIDPPGPTTSTLTVWNVFNWSGESGGRAAAEFNQTTQLWEAYQVECSGS